MQRFTKYDEGMSIVNIATGESGYNYYGKQRWGSSEWCIIKANIAGTEYTYLIGNTGYSTAWTNRGSETFKTPSQFDI